MRTNIIKIGNSKGVILPTEVLQELQLSLKSKVTISIEGDSIVIKAEPRQGWAEAARQAHSKGDDEILLPDVFVDEDLSDWVW